MTDFLVTDSLAGFSNVAVPYTNKSWLATNKMVPDPADVSSNAEVAKAWVWECTTAGTTTATPTWPASVTQDVTTVTQNGTVFTARKPGYSSGSTASWSFGTPYYDYAERAAAAGDRVLCDQNGVVSQSGCNVGQNKGSAGNAVQIISVSSSETPPTAGAAGHSSTAASDGFDHQFNGYKYFYGMDLKAGSGSANSKLDFFTVNQDHVIRLEECVLSLATTSSSARVRIGSGLTSGSSAKLTLLNTDIVLGATTQSIEVNGATLHWRGGTMAGTAAATTLFTVTGGTASRGAQIEIEGVDFSGLSTTSNLFSGSAVNLGGPVKVMLRNCKMPTGWVGAVSANAPGTAGSRIETDNLFDAGGTLVAMRVDDYAGTIVRETTLVQGTNTLSWKMTSNAKASFGAHELRSVVIHEKLSAADVGVSKTYTLEVLHDSLTDLTTKDLFLVLDYGNAGSVVYTGPANPLSSSALTTSTVTWTTTGLTNPRKQKLTATFTPTAAGEFVVWACLCKPSYTAYLSPFGTLA